MRKLAVIDLGTNTFHLLIADVHEDGSWTKVLRDRQYVSLAESGIQRIGQAAYHRGLVCLQQFSQLIAEHNVDIVRAFGTAALRRASNAVSFIQEVKSITGIAIEIIQGPYEALLISKGVRQVVPFTEENSLIMDIGGGSVEFILCNQNEVFWFESFPVGVAVLYNNFHRQEPMPEASMKALDEYLNSKLQSLFDNLRNIEVDRLIGASGTFDVLVKLLGQESYSSNYHNLDLQSFERLRQEVICLDLDERLAMPKLPRQRAELIVVAMQLLRFILVKTGITKMEVSSYAMKEGIIQEIIEGD